MTLKHFPRLRVLLCGAALVAATVMLAVNGARSQDYGGGKKEGQSKEMQPPDMEECMKKMAAAAEPGHYHKHLNALVGTWEVTSKFWMGPGEPQTGKGVAKRKWILGGRFLTEEFEGTSMDQPFSGYGITGYDNVVKKYVSTWCDSMGTGMMISEGTCDSDGKTFSYIGSYNCPIIGKAKKQRSQSRIISENKHIFEMFDTGPDGKEFKNLEVTYTRK